MRSLGARGGVPALTRCSHTPQTHVLRFVRADRLKLQENFLRGVLFCACACVCACVRVRVRAWSVVCQGFRKYIKIVLCTRKYVQVDKLSKAHRGERRARERKEFRQA